MNKGSQKSTAINHIDKTLDDYIKKAKGQTKAQPGQPKSGKKLAVAGKPKPGQGKAKKTAGVSRLSRGIGKLQRLPGPGQRFARGAPAQRPRAVLRTEPLRRVPLPRRQLLMRTGPGPRIRRALPPLRRAAAPILRRTGALERVILRPTGAVKAPPRATNKDVRTNLVQKKKANTQEKGEAKKSADSAKRLFVSDLPINVTNSDLYTLFGQFGPLSKCRIDYDNLGRSYGTAILEYKAEANAQQAMTEYNGAELDGKPIKIALSRAQAAGGDSAPASRKDSNTQNSRPASAGPAQKRVKGVKRRGALKGERIVYRDRPAPRGFDPRDERVYLQRDERFAPRERDFVPRGERFDRRDYVRVDRRERFAERGFAPRGNRRRN